MDLLEDKKMSRIGKTDPNLKVKPSHLHKTADTLLTLYLGKISDCRSH